MSTMPNDEPTRGRDEYTEFVALDCRTCGEIHDVDDDAASNGDPCVRCGSQATTAEVTDLAGNILRPYLAPLVGTITTTWFAARPALNQRSHIRVTGPGGTDLVPTGYSSGYKHRLAAHHYLAARHVAADLGDAVPVPGGSGYVFTIKKGI